MSDAATFRALAERCKAASGPDPAIDAALHLAVTGQRVTFAPKYTDYVDAIVWRIERKFPGCYHGYETLPGGTSLAGFAPKSGEAMQWVARGGYAASGASPALGFCGAFCDGVADLIGGAR